MQIHLDKSFLWKKKIDLLLYKIREYYLNNLIYTLENIALTVKTCTAKIEIYAKAAIKTFTCNASAKVTSCDSTKTQYA